MGDPDSLQHSSLSLCRRIAAFQNRPALSIMPATSIESSQTCIKHQSKFSIYLDYNVLPGCHHGLSIQDSECHSDQIIM